MLLVWELGYLVDLGVMLSAPCVGISLASWFGSEVKNSLSGNEASWLVWE